MAGRAKVGFGTWCGCIHFVAVHSVLRLQPCFSASLSASLFEVLPNNITASAVCGRSMAGRAKVGSSLVVVL
jgi:hypothetical protein